MTEETSALARRPPGVGTAAEEADSDSAASVVAGEVPGRRVAVGRTPRVGIVGAGQLARMTYQAAIALGIEVVVLGRSPEDPACQIARHALVGAPTDRRALEQLAARTDVVTFDHELVDVGLLEELERQGMRLAPGPSALGLATDKARQREAFSRAGIPVPSFAVLASTPGPGTPAGSRRPDARVRRAALERFADRHGWPLVLKAARGGYDGRGVFLVESLEDAEAAFARLGAAGVPRVVVEPRLELVAELAVLVARGADGRLVVYPPARTLQHDGICHEVLLPLEATGLASEIGSRARRLATEVARVVGAVGILAVELFAVPAPDGGTDLLVNEVAARPHNSGHWTIEGATTSQFEQHLRAICGLPLGEAELVASAVAMHNVLGAPRAEESVEAALREALAVPGAHVHHYAKAPRPGRKLGHVTVCGPDLPTARLRAAQAAEALSGVVW